MSSLFPLSAAVAASLLAVAPASAATLANSRITMSFDTLPGAPITDQDRVDSFVWINSQGTPTANLAATEPAGGPAQCHDPDEWFGEAEGYPDEGAAPQMVTAGEHSTLTLKSALAGKVATKGKGCSTNRTSGLTTTAYTLSNTAKIVNSVKLVRTFKFNANTPVFTNTGLRAYMVRMPVAPYHFTILPNAAGAITAYDANNCSSPCQVTDWNGKWLAQDDGQGNGIVVVRSPASKNLAFVVVDSDGFSNSNVSSVVLAQPTGGWKAPVLETEYLCPYDPTSWPTAQQAAGKLPTGCGVP